MRWLLRLLVRDEDRQAIESDLSELHDLHRRRHGERAAAKWLRRQRLIYPLHLLADRLSAIPGALRGLMSHLWRDIVYSARSLARTPTLALTIIATVAVGLGATTAMIGVVRAVLINPLPYQGADSVFWIYTDNPPYRFRFSVVDYRALEADHPAFSEVAAYQTSTVTVADSAGAERVTMKSVTGSYFPLLRQRAVFGRLFSPADDARDDQIAVLTAPFWQTRFGGDPSVVGRVLSVNGSSYTIVGILEPTDGPLERGISFFTAARWPPPTRKGPFLTMVLGRLRPDISRPAAAETLRATNARLFPLWRSSYQDEKATWSLQDLKERVIGDVGTTLVFVLAAVACVLLIACANAVNLLISRSLTRSRELAIRGALGASRGRLVQHLVAESAVLTIAAAIVACLVAAGALELVASYGATFIPRVNEIGISIPVLAWLAALSVLSGFIIFIGGLVPAIHTSRLGMDRVLRSATRSTTDGPAARRLRRGLVAAEFALATPLIVAAALVLASLGRLNRVDVGADMDRLLTASVSLPSGLYPRTEDRVAFWDRARARLAAMSGVEALAFADGVPPAGGGNSNNFDLEDRPTPAGQNQPISTWVAVSPDFFKTVGLRLERGRLLDERSLGEVVVDRAWATRFFPNEEVIGRRLKSGGCTSCPWTTVVGLVGNVKFRGLDQSESGTVYWPFVDFPNGYIVVRAAATPEGLATSLRQAMRELDPNLAVTDISTGEELVSTALVAPRYLSVLIGLFALTALVLSVIGIYGVMAYFVQQHTRDIGIRLALGGEPSAMRRMVVRQGLGLVAAGVAAGLVMAFFTARLLTSQLFGVSPTDPATLIAVAVALVSVALVACLVPARRAARLDPATILRDS